MLYVNALVGSGYRALFLTRLEKTTSLIYMYIYMHVCMCIYCNLGFFWVSLGLNTSWIAYLMTSFRCNNHKRPKIHILLISIHQTYTKFLSLVTFWLSFMVNPTSITSIMVNATLFRTPLLKSFCGRFKSFI